MLLLLLQSSATEAILMMTILCHEFGHGNMARYLGGTIDHILLWVFGGICFSTRPPGVYEPRKLLKNDLLIVAAGPTTHIFQAPFWGLILALLFALYTASFSGDVPQPLLFSNPWEAFLSALNPFSSQFAYSSILYVTPYFGKWHGLLWTIVGQAVSINVTLFLFNVFFPMYPADGSKLLVTSMMFCCGMPPRRAANILLCVSVPCAFLLLGYMAYTLYAAFSHITQVQSASLLNGMMGLMALMSLQESWNIYQLKKARRLYQHPLFQTARSWQRADRDRFGAVHRINDSEYDDDTPPFLGGCRDPSSGCSFLSCICPCLRPNANYVTDNGGGQLLGGVDLQAQATNRPLAGLPSSAKDVRAQRGNLLDKVEDRQKEQEKSVRELGAEQDDV